MSMRLYFLLTFSYISLSVPICHEVNRTSLQCSAHACRFKPPSDTAQKSLSCLYQTSGPQKQQNHLLQSDMLRHVCTHFLSFLQGVLSGCRVLCSQLYLFESFNKLKMFPSVLASMLPHKTSLDMKLSFPSMPTSL